MAGGGGKRVCVELTEETLNRLLATGQVFAGDIRCPDCRAKQCLRRLCLKSCINNAEFCKSSLTSKFAEEKGK